MTVELHFGSAARSKVLAGSQALCDAVRVTLGPRGRNVLIQNQYGAPKISKDGVTVARAVELPDGVAKLGADLIKEVASRVADSAGDGTTTATLLANHIFKEGSKHATAGRNMSKVLVGIKRATKSIVDYLEEHKTVVGAEDISAVALIASNGDREVADVISEAYRKVGKEGSVTAIGGQGVTHELEVVEGFSLDRGWVSPFMVTDQKAQNCVQDDTLVLLVAKKLVSVNPILPALEEALKCQKNILIIAEDFDSEVISTLVLNRMRAGLKALAVKAPGFGLHRTNILGDIAAYTGAVVLDEATHNLGTLLSELDAKAVVGSLGSAARVSAGRDETILLMDRSKADILKEVNIRKRHIEEHIKHSDSGYEREKMEERLGALRGGVAVIKVGGNSDLEVGEAKDRVEDALCAAKAALKGGVVPGGGTALLFASRELENLNMEDNDELIGVDIVKSACRVPLREIVNNSGAEGGLVVANLLQTGQWGDGYDARSSTYKQMEESGILDPCLVTCTALVDAASVASLLATTECVIVNQAGQKAANDMGLL